ncbi:MAG: DUF1819 family protein [Oligoflexia bacterium]|nr:DUF1819 family protein [Oligoflexia bacterium]
MSARPAETTQFHTRLLKCALEVEDARAYWKCATPGEVSSAQDAFDNYWFGAKSLARVKVLLTNFRARFDAFPDAFRVLHAWRHMDPQTRQVISHWHLQLTDPMVRAFTGDFLVQRREGLRSQVTRDLVVSWVGEQGPGRWTMSTRIQFASKLLSCAAGAGLLAGKRGPRQLQLPRISDEALTYGVYLLRGVDFDGTLLHNPYFRSLGMDGSSLEDRLKGLDALRFRRQGDLLDYGWRYPSLAAWAGDEHPAGGAA